MHFDKEEKKHQTLEKYQDEIEKNVKKLENEIEFYNKNTDCPTCNQTIDDVHRNCEIHTKEEKKTELGEAIGKIGMEISASLDLISEMQTTQENIFEESEVVFDPSFKIGVSIGPSIYGFEKQGFTLVVEQRYVEILSQ